MVFLPQTHDLPKPKVKDNEPSDQGSSELSGSTETREKSEKLSV